MLETIRKNVVTWTWQFQQPILHHLQEQCPTCAHTISLDFPFILTDATDPPLPQLCCINLHLVFYSITITVSKCHYQYEQNTFLKTL